MDERGCLIPEERWIDWHRGQLSAEEAAWLVQHRSECGVCLDRWAFWGSMFTGQTEAAPPSGGWRRQALRLRVWRRGLRKRIGKTEAGRRLALAAAGVGLAGMVILGLFLGTLQTGGNASDQKSFAQRHEPAGAAVMSKPDTVVYSLGSEQTDSVQTLALASGTNAPSGRVWVNGRTHEMFLMLDGLLPSNDLDVQAWAEYAGRRTNLGVMKFHERKAHLYSRNARLAKLDALAISMEPKGGSAAPTSPETVMVRFNHQ